ncbi:MULTISPECIES: EpsG family protein [unclassified Sphingobacterium]|uniref:EpsG family protein n=1 Tax=unclassified Sphingobacterium TaxID=2609468 RepID=UPI0025CE51BE|nr:MULTISPECIES: EpsG family protein [unclassified Sphingobacterium]
MNIYIIIFTILSLFSLIESTNLDRRITLSFYFIFCFGFYILSFVRWEIGTDWKNYYDYFQSVGSIPFEDDVFEWGYSILTRAIAGFTDNYNVFLFAAGLILFSFQSMALKKMSPYPIMSLLFLWSIQFANVLFVRQWIAIAILMFSVIYIEKRQFIPFILLVVLAAGFHRTSWIFVLAWWVYQMNFSRKRMVLLLLASIGFSVVITKVLEFLSGGIGGVVQAKIDTYLSDEFNDDTNSEIGLLSVIIRGFANKFLILFTSFYLYDRIIEKYPQFRGYLNLYWFGAIIYFSTISISVVFVRISYAFDVFQIILVAYFFKLIESPLLRFTAFLVLVCYLFLRMRQQLNGPYADEFVPFKLFF